MRVLLPLLLLVACGTYPSATPPENEGGGGGGGEDPECVGARLTQGGCVNDEGPVQAICCAGDCFGDEECAVAQECVIPPDVDCFPGVACGTCKAVCPTLTESDCLRDERCVWYEPGCGAPTTPPQGACYPATCGGCEADGLVCASITVLPACAAEGCSACGEVVNTCSGTDAQLCEHTGGTWNPTACGDTYCGQANICEAVIPGCDCGPVRNFVSKAGCVDDEACR